MNWWKRWRNRRKPKVEKYPTLQTERLVLRMFELGDVVDLYAYAQNPAVALMAGWPPHQSIEDSRRVVENFMAHGDVWAIVEKRSGRVIGTMGLHLESKRAVANARMLGYALGEAEWGQGFATEAGNAVLQFAFDGLHCPVVSVYHFPLNNKSKHVIKKLGFKLEGKLRLAYTMPDGTLTDELCYSMTPEEFAARQTKEAAKIAQAASNGKG